MKPRPHRNPWQVAREALSELELPHLYRAVARGSPRRQELFKSRGLFQVPYLEVQPLATPGEHVRVRVTDGVGVIVTGQGQGRVRVGVGAISRDQVRHGQTGLCPTPQARRSFLRHPSCSMQQRSCRRPCFGPPCPAWRLLQLQIASPILLPSLSVPEPCVADLGEYCI